MIFMPLSALYHHQVSPQVNHLSVLDQRQQLDYKLGSLVLQTSMVATVRLIVREEMMP